MSVRVMTLVWALELPDSDKIVLLALADCANDEGHCWPGMRSLVAKCSKTDRTIQASIKRLCEAGHLTRREVPGKGCNYTVHPRKDFTPEAASPPKGTTQTPEATSGKPLGTVNSEAKASYTAVGELWNSLSRESGIPEIRVWNNSRKQMCNARAKEHGLDALLRGVRNIHSSRFCRGLAGHGRKADIMLLLQPKTCARVLEGFYNDDEKPGARAVVRDAAWYEDRAKFFESVNDPHQAEECRRKAAAVASPIGEIAASLVGRAA